MRSNAKRHLRTHGINPATETTSKALEYAVGFETPMVVSDVRQANQVPVMLKWVLQSLTSRTSIAWNNKSSYSVCTAISLHTVVIGMGLWLLERGIHIRRG